MTTPSAICFVSLVGLYALPYLSKYTGLISEPYDIIYWNRYASDEHCGARNHYVMNFKISRISTLQKLIGYIKFRRFASRILKENKYKKIVLLSGNVAVLLKDILLKYYRGKYIIDIRDYYLEHNKVYYNTEKRVINGSGLAVISSPAYKVFLPKHEYLVVHNSPCIPRDVVDSFRRRKADRKSVKADRPLILSFIGSVRFFEQDKMNLSYFANDDRFLIRYIGLGADVLEEHCRRRGITNVDLRDRFSPEQTLGFFLETDMILNLYGNKTPLLDYALSNKLYYAAMLGLPILVCPNTYMEEVSIENGFGFAVDITDSTSKDRLYEYYHKIDWQDFFHNCDQFMQRVCFEEESFTKTVSGFLNGE